jgi:hypothetical protein
LSKTSIRIERAADLLDQTAPGWDRRIDLDALDMSHSRYCIIGQIHGSYYSGLAKIDGEAQERPAAFGFMTWGRETFGTLTDKWRDYLRERRAA